MTDECYEKEIELEAFWGEAMAYVKHRLWKALSKRSWEEIDRLHRDVERLVLDYKRLMRGGMSRRTTRDDECYEEEIEGFWWEAMANVEYILREALSKRSWAKIESLYRDVERLLLSHVTIRALLGD